MDGEPPPLTGNILQRLRRSFSSAPGVANGRGAQELTTLNPYQDFERKVLAPSVAITLRDIQGYSEEL
jgi:hypothetical protein